MLKDYISMNHQTLPAEQRVILTVDLVSITSYVRNPTQLSTTVYVNNLSNGYTVYMTQADFDEFKLQVKIANRLKRAYE